LASNPNTRGLILAAKGILVALGVLAGAWFYDLAFSGALVNWERLPDPPSSPAQLDIGPYDVLQVRTSDGARYQLTGEGWIPPEDIEPGTLAFPTAYPCDRSSGAFASTAHPPPQIAECVENTYPTGDTIERIMLAADQQGALYKWPKPSSNSVYLPVPGCILYPTLGGFIVFAAIKIVQVLVRRTTL
jgi:hypothetical protein